MQLLLKNSFGKVVFQFWSRDFFREAKIRFLAAILKPYRVLKIFLLEYGYN